MSSYNEQSKVAKLDAIERSAKHFLLNTKKYTGFAERKTLIKSDANKSSSSDKLCSEFAPRNCKYSEITNSGSIISELAPNCCHSSIVKGQPTFQTRFLPLIAQQNRQVNFPRVLSVFSIIPIRTNDVTVR